MVSIDQIKNGVAYYVDQHIMARYPAAGWQKVAAGAVVAMAINGYADKIKSASGLDSFGLVKNGDIDIDAFATEVRNRMPSGGLKIDIPMLGEATFFESDINELVDIINGRRY